MRADAEALSNPVGFAARSPGAPRGYSRSSLQRRRAFAFHAQKHSHSHTCPHWTNVEFTLRLDNPRPGHQRWGEPPGATS